MIQRRDLGSRGGPQSERERPRRDSNATGDSSLRNGSPPVSECGPDSSRGPRHETQFPGAGPPGTESAPGVTTLDSCIESASDDPAAYWRRVYDDGVFGLLRAFAGLVRGWKPETDRAIDHPDRIRVHSDGRLSLIDGDSEGDPELRTTRATPYRAPELLMANRTDADDPARIYSLAAILHHSITGSPPYPGREPLEMVHRMLSGDRIKDSRWDSTVPRGLQGFLADALSFDPQLRPATVRSFALGLEAAAGGDKPRAVPLHAVRAGSGAYRQRIVVVSVLLVAIVGVWMLAGAPDRRRDEALQKLEGVLTTRPFPVHGEDPPHHPLASTTLEGLREDIESFKDDARVQLYFGWALLRADRVDEAQRAFRRVTNLEPERIAGWVSAGIGRLESGDRGGVNDIEHGLAFTARTTEDSLFQGAAQLYLLRFDDASRSFAEAARKDPNSFEAWYHQALALHYEGRTKDARVAIDRARSMRSTDLWVTWLGAELLAADGKGEHVPSYLNAQRTRLVGVAPLLLRTGSLMSRVGKGDDGKQWQARAARLISEPGESPRIHVGERGRVQMGDRGVLFFGPPPL